ncbi:DUF2156 domain-containing protein [Helicobacter suis]|uniref:DUF2156 domain-containing protein n=1 Tax=Helicobacter suis TaxID=104628 RepID=UPI001F075BB6|nr:phosphatidylglycerol lysyltransferase domain-containing protein [Helicobacter suis]
MHFKPICLEDKSVVDAFLKQDDFLIADVNFTNLYLWRLAREISLCMAHGCLLIRSQYPQEKPFYFYPIGAGDKRAVLEELLHTEEALEIRALQEKHKQELECFFPGVFDFQAQRDRFDYIYSVPELISLQGKKFHKKKNHLNAFLKTYPHFTYKPLLTNNIPQVKEALQSWHALDDSSDMGLEHEYQGILEVLAVYERLHLQGGVIFLGERVASFSFGEKIQEKVAVIHIEKADPEIRGAYQMINQQLLKNAFADCELVNREEDLGIEGLRQAKMGYHPLFLLEKYHALKR